MTNRHDPLNVRSEFPITERATYLNNPAIGPLSRSAHAAGVAFLDERMLDPWPDPPPTGLLRLRTLKQRVRTTFAQLYGADPSEVGVVESTSAGENIVAKALLTPGDSVVVDDLHFESSFLLYREMEKSHGITLRIVPSRHGITHVEDVAAHCDRTTKLISVSWVSNRNGYRADIGALAQLAHSHGGYLYVDAIQAIGTITADLHALDIDFLTTGAYKWLYANFGVSPFYVKQSLLPLIPNDRFGHTHVANVSDDYQFTIKHDASKYEYSAQAHTSTAQLAGALDLLARVGLRNIEAHAIPLANYLWRELDAMGYQMFTPPATQSAVVAFTHGIDVPTLNKRMADEQIAILLREGDVSLRAGVGFYNNQHDVDHFIQVMRDLRQLRRY